MDDARIQAVRAYLDKQFPDSRIEVIQADAEIRRAGTILFRVDAGPDVYLLEISVEFLDDRSPDEVGPALHQHETADQLRTHQGRTIVLAETGFLLR